MKYSIIISTGTSDRAHAEVLQIGYLPDRDQSTGISDQSYTRKCNTLAWQVADLAVPAGCED